MSDEKYIQLLSNIKALEMILRSLVASGFSKSENPRQDAFKFFELTIAGLARSAGQENEANRKFYDMVEDDIRLFGAAIDGRLREFEKGKE